MLSAQNISVGYDKQVILNEISLSAARGERIALLGLNGTGKSTLMLSLAGLLPLLSGEVCWGDEKLSQLASADRSKLRAIVTTDHFKTGNMSLFEVVAMGRYPYTGLFGKLNEEDVETVNRVLETCGLTEIQERLFEQLSDGQKQRSLIARALTQETPMLLLDEPTSFLDVRGKAEVFDLLSSLRNQLVVFSTHEVEKAMQVATRYWVIDSGGVLHDINASDNSAESNIRRLLGLTEKEVW